LCFFLSHKTHSPPPQTKADPWWGLFDVVGDYLVGICNWSENNCLNRSWLSNEREQSLQLPFASKMDRGQLHGSLSVRSARVRAVLGARVALAPTCGVGMDLNWRLPLSRAADQGVYMAKLAEQAERYDEMVESDVAL
jgi:hypothetical protein